MFHFEEGSSIYIQITTFCNMTCEHCIFSCEKGKKGEHMTKATFRKAVSLCEEYDGSVALGGGEPTMHPKFWDFFGHAMGSEVESVWMATNGSITQTALALADLANGSEKFSIALSTDHYHDPISPHVMQRFMLHGHELRDVTASGKGVINKGAAFENGAGETDGCGCPILHIKPSGEIRMCGCPDSLSLGNVNNIDGDVISRAIEIANEVLGGCGDDLDEIYADYIFGRREYYDCDREEAA